VTQGSRTKIAAEEECTIPESLRLMDQGRIDIVKLDVTVQFISKNGD
jgi:L-alanine-DL-glutamate epimerase-like enolase superfamily enzyme